MIISQYIQISNHYIVHLKLMLYVNYISIKKRIRNLAFLKSSPPFILFFQLTYSNIIFSFGIQFFEFEHRYRLL